MKRRKLLIWIAAIAAIGAVAGTVEASTSSSPAPKVATSLGYIPDGQSLADASSFTSLEAASSTIGLPAAVVSAVDAAGSEAATGVEVGQDVDLGVEGYLVAMRDGDICFALSDPVKTSVTCRTATELAASGADIWTSVNGTTYVAGVRGDGTTSVDVSGSSVPVTNNFYLTHA